MESSRLRGINRWIVLSLTWDEIANSSMELGDVLPDGNVGCASDLENQWSWPAFDHEVDG